VPSHRFLERAEALTVAGGSLLFRSSECHRLPKDRGTVAEIVVDDEKNRGNPDRNPINNPTVSATLRADSSQA
jgi:hypothetical protein